MSKVKQEKSFAIHWIQNLGKIFAVFALIALKVLPLLKAFVG